MSKITKENVNMYCHGQGYVGCHLPSKDQLHGKCSVCIYEYSEEEREKIKKKIRNL